MRASNGTSNFLWEHRIGYQTFCASVKRNIKLSVQASNRISNLLRECQIEWLIFGIEPALVWSSCYQMAKRLFEGKAYLPSVSCCEFPLECWCDLSLSSCSKRAGNQLGDALSLSPWKHAYTEYWNYFSLKNICENVWKLWWKIAKLSGEYQETENIIQWFMLGRYFMFNSMYYAVLVILLSTFAHAPAYSGMFHMHKYIRENNKSLSYCMGAAYYWMGASCQSLGIDVHGMLWSAVL